MEESSVSLMSGQIGREAEVTAVQAAGRDLRRELLLVARRVGDDADRATFGVGAEQGALRTLEDFDAVHIQQVLVGTDGAGQVDAVQVHADGGIEVEGEIVLADAADRGGEHRAVAGEGRAGIQVDARGQITEGIDAGQIALLQGVGGERRDGNRHRLHVLGAALGGDDHLLQGARVIGRGAGSRSARSARRRPGADRQSGDRPEGESTAAPCPVPVPVEPAAASFILRPPKTTS